MTTKPQRNEPCHCGSGKKYKKCCLNSDLEKDNIEILESEDVSSLEGDDMLDTWEDSFIEAFENDETIDAFFNSELSNIQNETIEAWWSEMDELNNPEKKIEHIKYLIDNHSDLVVHVGLEESVIYDSVSYYLKSHKYGDFISFLLYFKDKCPDAYNLSYDYYNYYIIVWYLSINKLDKVHELINDYVTCESEKLPELVNLLEATNNYDILIPFIEENYTQILDDGTYLLDEFLIDPLFSQAFLKHLKPNFTNDDINNVLKDLKDINIDFDDVTLTEKYWEDNYNSILCPYKPWNTAKQKANTYLNSIYTQISFNFLGFLIFNKGFNNYYSYFLHSKLAKVLFNHLKESPKKSNSIFRFTIRTIEKTVVTLSKNMMWIDYTELHSLLLATYYFMEYLELCGNLEPEERNKIQKEISELYNSNYNNLASTYEEFLILKTIP